VTVSELGERALVARILSRLPRPPASVLVGAGDDAAVLETARNERLVVTTDAVVEGVHVSRAYSTPSDIGHKALAVNLSDLAAMAAAPRWAVVSLVLPGSWLVTDVEDLMDGCVGLARRHGVAIVGGNIARTDGALVVDITAGGEVRPRRWLTREGARPGDDVYVSGSIGASAAGLEMLRATTADPSTSLRAGGRRHPPSLGRLESSFGETGTADEARLAADGCVARYRRPEPRVRLGLAMGRARAARAAMDLSDGLADALRQVAGASGCGVRVEAGSMPIDHEARAWWTSRSVDPIRAALVGGDDYELLFAIPKRGGRLLRAVQQRVADPPLTRIGVFTKDAREFILDRDGSEEPLPEGYEHFREPRTANRESRIANNE
jgi:thiamine-monophosphate kinase